MCEQVCTRVFLKKGADLSIFVSQNECGSCSVRYGFMLDWGRDLGPALIAGPNGYLPEAVIASGPFLLETGRLIAL